jgi:hypothetical protein
VPRFELGTSRYKAGLLFTDIKPTSNDKVIEDGEEIKRSFQIITYLKV